MPWKHFSAVIMLLYYRMRADEPHFVFWAERGEFRLWNRKRIRSGEVLEARKGALLLIKPSPRRWQRSVAQVQGLAVALGAVVLGGLTEALEKSRANPLAFPAVLAPSFLLCLLALMQVNKARFRSLARHPGQPPASLTVKGIEYHRVYQRMLVSMDGMDLRLTVAGRVASIRKALSLAGQCELPQMGRV